MTVKILQGDCIEVMRTMDAESVDCVVTSPPYWGLRDYGVEGQMGLEPTLGEHLEVMVNVFAEIHRILKPTGTVWLNYGDCYATTPNGKSAAAYKADKSDDRTFRDKPFSTIGPIYDPEYRKRTTGGIHEKRWEDSGGRIVAGGVMKPKDLCMVPNRVAISLQEWGWWVRSEIIWAKPNPMPESITDRPATSHEKIFLLTKSAKYFYDAEAVKEPITESSAQRLSQDIENQAGSGRANGGTKSNGTMKAVSSGVGFRYRDDDRSKERVKSKTHSRGTKKTPPIDSAGQGHKDWCQYMTKDDEITHRNLRNVWHIGSKPFDLEMCVSCSKIYDRGSYRKLKRYTDEDDKLRIVCQCGCDDEWLSHFATFPPQLAETCIKAGCPADGVVFDPFGGAGTTGLVADQLQRDAILIELNPEYIEIAKHRIESGAPMFTDVYIEVPRCQDTEDMFEEEK